MQEQNIGVMDVHVDSQTMWAGGATNREGTSTPSRVGAPSPTAAGGIIEKDNPAALLSWPHCTEGGGRLLLHSWWAAFSSGSGAM